MANAQKVVLGKRPETFHRVVTFPMLDGSTGCIPLDYVYRTRKEHAAFVDEIKAKIDAQAKAESERIDALIAAKEPVPEFTQADLVKYQVEAAVETIMGAVKSWKLDVPFDREAVEQLVDELPAAVNAIISNYRDAITEGARGN